MEYETYHILDINIEDETQRHGRDITIRVDTHEMINIEIGNSITVRTDEAGVDDLREALERALIKIEEVRYESASTVLSTGEDEMIQAGIDAREKQKGLSAQQTHDPYDYTLSEYDYNPDDPRNW